MNRHEDPLSDWPNRAVLKHHDGDGDPCNAALVLSACVQMPSLAVVPKVEALTSKPVVTASIATTYALLRALNIEPVVPGAGALLSGAY